MKTHLLSVAVLALASSVVAQNDAPVIRTLDGQLQEKTLCLNPEYLVYLPKADLAAKLPLLIYLHGAGGVGNDINKIKGQSGSVWKGIMEFDKGPCIVVAPQCLRQMRTGERGTWFPDDLNVLLQRLKATLPIDHKRVYLTGNSMGGYGTWAWGAHSPHHFAAIAPISGGIGRGGPKDVTSNLDQWAANLVNVPVYAFAGAKDKVVPAERSERVIAAIRKAGGTRAKIKIYPDEGHGARRVVFSTREFYDWLFSKRVE